MAKINKYEQARIDGFNYFVSIYNKQNIRIPEIDDEIKRRQIAGKPIGLDKQTELEYCKGIQSNLLETVLILVEWVLHTKCGFGKDRLNRFKNWFNDAAYSIDAEYITWGDIRATLMKETGIETEIHWFGKPVKNEELNRYGERE